MCIPTFFRGTQMPPEDAGPRMSMAQARSMSRPTSRAASVASKDSAVPDIALTTAQSAVQTAQPSVLQPGPSHK
ncbi:hypothetical protein CJU90_1592 [Yarrowia sp. C11]|nr:hypothetical protein CKK34_0316 [Yarrowia sp. E02]KAG5371554.1 hypothetical protein CJU90_1592 [Yarrowia sp. C11]